MTEPEPKGGPLPGLLRPPIIFLSAILLGIALNRVRPVLDAVEEDTRELSELLRSYSLGLDVLRETAARVSAGEPVDMAGARRVIERLATQVAGDPAHALLVTAVKSYDEYTYYHMMNVCILALAMGQAIGLRQDQVATLGLGALLHPVSLDYGVRRQVFLHEGRGRALGRLLLDADLLEPCAQREIADREEGHRQDAQYRKQRAEREENAHRRNGVEHHAQPRGNQ